MLTEQQQANEEIFKQIIELVDKLNIKRKDDNNGKTSDCVFFIAVQHHKDETGKDIVNTNTVFSGSEYGLANGFNQIIEESHDNPIIGPILNATSNALHSTGVPQLIAVGGMVADYAQSEYNAIECDCSECQAERAKNKCKGE